MLSLNNDFAESPETSASLAILEGSDGFIICLLNLFMVWLVLLANDNHSFKDFIKRFEVKLDPFFFTLFIMTKICDAAFISRVTEAYWNFLHLLYLIINGPAKARKANKSFFIASF